jgi:hypothetical protein
MVGGTYEERRRDGGGVVEKGKFGVEDFSCLMPSLEALREVTTGASVSDKP